MKKLTLLLLIAVGAWGQTQVQQTITINTPSPPSVTGVSLNYTGSLGQSEICYWIVATYPRGNVVTGSPTCVFTGQPISSGNTVVVKWNLQPAVTSYDVLKTTTESLPSSCTCKLGTTSSATITDTGASLTSYTLSNVASPVAEFINLNNQDYTAPELQIYPYYVNVIGLQFPDGSQQTTAFGGGGAPTGPAGGDLGGIYPNPDVLKVHGLPYPTAGAVNTVPVITAGPTITYEAVPNAALANSAVTISTTSPLGGGGAVSLGGTLTLTATTAVTAASALTNLSMMSGAGGQASKVTNIVTDSGLNNLVLPGSVSTGSGGGTTGTIAMSGLTSGTVTIKPQDAAGTWTFKWPITAGTNLQFLQTDGSGNTTWAAPAGSGTVSAGLINELAWYTAGGTTVSGLTTGNSGVLVTSAGGVPSISSTLPANIILITPSTTGIAFASLATPGNGTWTYCTDCKVTSGIDNTCTDTGSGAFALRIGGAWKCVQ